LNEELSKETHPGYQLWKNVIPLPPLELMERTGAPTVENFLVVGDAWSQVLSKYIKTEAALLDIGCGCGKTARMLITNPLIKRYIGFDVIKPLIEWSKRFIFPLSESRFNFIYFDLYSTAYNPEGKLRSKDFTFPVEDSSIDLTFAASVFTHLLEEDARHYLNEITRILKENGRAVASIHVTPEQGERYSGTENRIDILPEYFIDMAAKAGLEVDERLGELCGQETFVFKRK
jgi:SAM-dependent methyltransferase